MSIRSTLRRTALTAAAVAAAISLAACSPSGGSGASGGETENPDGLITPGEIRVASLGDAKPYTFTDEAGQFTGFDVELFTDVAHRIGIDEVVFTGQDFSGLLAAVANGQFDVGVAAIGITNERKKTVDFSDGYLAGYLTVMASPDSGITDESSLAGKRLGVVQGTLQEAYAVKNFTDTDLVRFPDNNAAISAVSSRQQRLDRRALPRLRSGEGVRHAVRTRQRDRYSLVRRTRGLRDRQGQHGVPDRSERGPSRRHGGRHVEDALPEVVPGLADARSIPPLVGADRDPERDPDQLTVNVRAGAPASGPHVH